MIQAIVIKNMQLKGRYEKAPKGEEFKEEIIDFVENMILPAAKEVESEREYHLLGEILFAWKTRVKGTWRDTFEWRLPERDDLY